MNLRKFIPYSFFTILIFSSFAITAYASTDWGNHRYAPAIYYLYGNDIVEGYEDGTFKPDNTINRAEFLKIALEASDYVVNDSSNCYSDVTNDWYAKYVCTATELGLVEGYEDGTFKPGDEINFAEASKIVSNAMNLEQEEDDSGIWHKKYVQSLVDLRALPTTIYSFEKKISRGDMAEIIWRVLENQNSQITATFKSISHDNGPTPRLYYDLLPEPFMEYVKTFDIQLEPHRTIEGIDLQVLKEIAFIADIHYMPFPNDEYDYQHSTYLLEYKGIITLILIDDYYYLDMPSIDSAKFINGLLSTNEQKLILLKYDNNIYRIIIEDKKARLEYIDWLNFDSFVQIDESVYKDGNIVFSISDGSFIKYENIDSLSFEKLQFCNEDDDHCSLDNKISIYIDNKNLYFINNDNQLQIFEGADPGTFEIFDYQFLKDKNNIYYLNGLNKLVQLQDADSSTFMIEEFYDNNWILYDDNNIFEYDVNAEEWSPVLNFDLSMAQPLENDLATGYISSLLNVYKYNGEIYSHDYKNQKLIRIDEIDYNTINYEVVNYKHIIFDKNNVYILHNIGNVLTKLEGSDKDTFEILADSYDYLKMFKDKNNIYYTNDISLDIHIIENVDLASFEILNDWRSFIARDKYHVYQMDRKGEIYISGVFDAETIEFNRYGYDFYYLIDKNGFYYNSDPDFSEYIKLEDIESSSVGFRSSMFNNYLFIYDSDTLWAYNQRYMSMTRISDFNPDTFDFDQDMEVLINSL